MQENLVIIKVEEVFQRLFKGLPELKADISSKDISEWDSLRHVMLITQLEEEFGINFELDDMLAMTTFGDICQNILKKIQ